jgi:hypothetical protein
MKLRRRAKERIPARCLLTNPTRGRKATWRAAGIERRASLVTTQHRGPSFSQTGEGRTQRGNLAETAKGPGGVMAAARQEGMSRNWRAPPGPTEKDRGAR